MRSRVSRPHRRLFQPNHRLAVLHVFKLNKVSSEEFLVRHTQATVSRSRLPSQKLPHRARRAIHPHTPPPLSNTVRIRMESLP